MHSSLQELTEEGLLNLRDDESYEATRLGQAVVASGFAPEDGLFVYDELKTALQAFVMDGDLHVFYMFTPLQVAMNSPIDWPIFRDQLDNLDESGLRALQFVGVSPGFVNSMYAFPPPPPPTPHPNFNLPMYQTSQTPTGSKAAPHSKKPPPSKSNKAASTAAPTQPSNSAISATKSH